jgi:hypothetical protein
MGIFCELAKSEWQCQIREVLIWLLIDQRLGWLALGLSIAHWFIRFSLLSAITFFTASIGLVLYNVELSGPAWLIAGIAITTQQRLKAMA